jgi:hypothetical protein
MILVHDIVPIRRPNRLKITTEMTGVPWNQTLTANFVSVHFQMDVFFQPHGTGRFADYNTTSLSYNTTNQLLAFEFEKCFLIDGVPFCNDQYYATEETSIGPFTEPLNLYFPVGVALCDPAFGKWNHAVYDPQLVSVFLSVPPPDSDPTSPIAKSNKAVLIAVPLVVGIIVVAVIVFVILVFNVPALKARFTPARLTTREVGGRSTAAAPQTHYAPPKASPSTVASSTAATTAGPAGAATQAAPKASGGWTKSAKPAS